MSAAWHGTPEAVDILVENGAIVDIQDTEVLLNFCLHTFNVITHTLSVV